ncbi:MAG TPA: 2-oxoacid:acceptor oxidoreductase family protein [Polyangiaceae bacterium]|nr:2-oxoacid:acceptor oxidoreductase family protein [Polyangiaceae bacterium]
MMFQVRLHGRGGQGTVTAAELLSVAAFHQGQFAQAFPSFGSERMGAPVMAFCRLDTVPIRLREPVVEPDAVLIQDATLLHCVDVFQGLRPGGYVLVNTGKALADLGLDDLVARLPSEHVQTIAATELALRHVGKPVPNAGLLGAFAAMTGAVTLASLEGALRARFQPSVAGANVAAARAAYASLASPNRSARC